MTVTEYGYTSDQILELSKAGLEQVLDTLAATSNDPVMRVAALGTRDAQAGRTEVTAMEAPVASPSLAGERRQAGPAQRFAYLVGGTLVLIGLAHLSPGWRSAAPGRARSRPTS